jgi:uncharacterized protein
MSTDWLVPDELAPVTTGAMHQFYQAAGEGRLEMPFCGACSLALELEQMTCDRCGGEPCWQVVEPNGRVHACTTVHRRETGLVLATDPYQVVDVELSSGHRLVMTTQARTDHCFGIGEAVAIGFRHVGAVALPAIAGTLGSP